MKLSDDEKKKVANETIEVLEYFKSKGYKMGVISDTSPSLEYILQQLGIAKYFTSFTASSLVGAGKTSPIIFNAALSAQSVKGKVFMLMITDPKRMGQENKTLCLFCLTVMKVMIINGKSQI